MSDSGPTDPITPLAQAAAQIAELYKSLIVAGVPWQAAAIICGQSVSGASGAASPD